MKKLNSFDLKSNKFFVFIIIIIGILACADDQSGYPPLKTNLPLEEITIDLEKYLPDLMNRGLIPGLSLALIRDGKVVYDHGFGVKSVDSKKAVTDNTIFEAASLSKPVFACAVMQLVQEGVLDLDKPLISYASDEFVAEKFWARPLDDPRIRLITARLVLTHRTGLPNWRNNNPINFIHDPDSTFGYSGEGFYFLQMIVVHVLEQPINEIMTERVFQPLEMIHSSFTWKDSYDSLTAYPHDLAIAAGTKRKPESANMAGTLHTTAADYGKFIGGLLNHRLLSQETTMLMFTPQSPLSGDHNKDIFWGLGVGLQQTSAGIAFWHWGDNGPFKAYMVGFPKQKIGLVYFANSISGLSVVNRISELALGGNQPVLTSEILSNYDRVDTPGMDFVQVLAVQGVDSATNLAVNYLKNNPENPIIKEQSLNSLGYSFLGEKKIDEAIKLFELNVRLYPDAFNVYDSLGEGYMEKGEISLAIVNYKKSIELNPENTNGIERLKILEEMK